MEIALDVLCFLMATVCIIVAIRQFRNPSDVSIVLIALAVILSQIPSLR